MSTQVPNPKKQSRVPQCGGGFVRANLKAYLDGELSPVRRWLVGLHVSRCSFCREEAAWLQRLGKNMRQLEAAHPRPELRARILATLPPMVPASVPQLAGLRPNRNSALRYALGGAFCVVVLAGAFAAERVLSASKTGANTVTAPVRSHEDMANQPNASSAKQNPPAIVEHSQVIEPRDPTSLAANIMTEQQNARAKQEAARQLPKSWNSAVAAVRVAGAQAQVHDKPYVQVALEVASIASAEKRLNDWAHAAGAAVKVVTGKDNSHPTVAVVLTIRPASSSALFAGLKKAGTVVGMPAASVSIPSKLAAIPVASDAPNPAPTPGDVHTNDHLSKPIPILAPYGARSKPTIGKPTTASAIIVVVQLLPTSPP